MKRFLRELQKHIEASGDPDGFRTRAVRRLIFVYLLQESGCLNGDRKYLQRRLADSRARAANAFHADCILPLCFGALSTPAGQRGAFEGGFAGVPCLQEGLFLPDPGESEWRAATRAQPGGPAPSGGEYADWLELFAAWRWSLDESDEGCVTPEVLSRLCEATGSTAALGVHYTGRDVADYICRNTVLPHLLQGVTPPMTRDGLSRCIKNDGLGRSDSLPVESDAEYEARRERRKRLQCQAGALEVDNFIGENLDLRPLALDVIRGMEEPEQLWRFYRRLRDTRVLDPTCGSGAFLLTAMDVLFPLHTACLDRMGEWRCPQGREPTGKVGPLSEQFGAEVREARRCGRDYFVGATILEKNLFGVDLMDDAVETCRMRLLMRVLAHLPRRTGCASGPEKPLRTRVLQGNAVVGEDCADAGWSKGKAPEASPGAQRPFHWPVEFPDEMRGGGFDVVIGNPPYVDSAEAGRQGRPNRFRTERCPNVYAWVVERSLRLLRPAGRMGFVVPVSAVSAPAFRPLMDLLRRQECWISTYSNRPAKLFEGVEQRLAILLTGPAGAGNGDIHVTPYQHWYQAERPHLFDRLTYCRATIWAPTGMPVKSGTPLAEAVFSRLAAHRGRLEELARPGELCVWLHDGPTYWIRALAFPPNPDRKERVPGHYHRIPAATQRDAWVLSAVLSSSTFYFFFKMVSNCRDLGRKEWSGFPIDPLPPVLWERLAGLGERLEDRLRATAVVRTRVYPSGRVRYAEHYPARAKDVIDDIDGVLAGHYRFSDEELEFVRTHDLKYRMSAS